MNHSSGHNPCKLALHTVQILCVLNIQSLFFFPLPLLLSLGNVQHISNAGKGRNLSEAYPAVLQPFLGQKGKKGLAHPSLPAHVRNAVLAAALFPEFLKELAALAQEHSILCYKILGDFEDYY